MLNTSIPRSVGVKQDKPKGFAEAIQDEVLNMTRDKVFVPVNEGPVKSRSTKANTLGTVLIECRGLFLLTLAA